MSFKPRRSLGSLIALGLLAGPIAASAASVTIDWTAPGDDGLVGRATAYDLRYSLSPITAANFALATAVAGVPAPKTAGSAESFTITNLVAGSKYYFAIRTKDDAANWSAISNVLSYTLGVTATEPAFVLSFSPPSPNPARESTRWSYTLPAAGELAIEAFDLSGRRIARIASTRRPAGAGAVVWNLRDDHGARVAPGVYLVRLSYGSYVTTKRLIVTH